MTREQIEAEALELAHEWATRYEVSRMADWAERIQREAVAEERKALRSWISEYAEHSRRLREALIAERAFRQEPWIRTFDPAKTDIALRDEPEEKP